MALLNQKERVLDIVLTDKGRELMARNQLNFSYFTFSDEGIDYSGSLNYINISSSIDDIVHRNMSFEADQRTNSLESLANNDLQNFLYTIPAGSKVLPTIVTNVDNNTIVSLARQYITDYITLHTKKRNKINNIKGAIVRVSVPKEDLTSRIHSYVQSQKQQISQKSIASGDNSVGMSAGDSHIILPGDKALNKTTGAVLPLSSLTISQATDQFKTVEISSIKKEIEIVSGIDTVKIDLLLQAEGTPFVSGGGFLVEVFNSGSDGVLTKLVRDSVSDPDSDEVVQEGFSGFLDLGIDED
jgi:hypothetical protein